jgi:Ca2+/Na+ antiporter
VLGITGLVVELPLKSSALLSYDFPWLILISLIIFPLMRYFTRGTITRWQGFLMFSLYIVYILGVFFT